MSEKSDANKAASHKTIPSGSPAAILIYSFVFLVLACVWFGARGAGIPVEKIVRDPLQVLGGKPFVGFLSNLNILAWTVGANACMFAWLIMQRSADSIRWKKFFLFAGLLTWLLLIDDLFMIHDGVFPFNEKILIGLYGIITLTFFYKFRRIILQTRRKWLAAAIAILAFSLLMDRGIGKYIVPNKEARTFLEDAFKFLGVVTWSYYFVLTARDALLSRLPLRAQSSPSA